MILIREKRTLKILPVDLLMVASFSYLGSGILYGAYVLNNVYESASWSFFSCLLSWFFLRKRAINNAAVLDIELSSAIRQKLIFLSFFGLACMLLFIASSGADYIAADKIDRSEQISSTFILRTPFYAFIISLFILYADTSKRYSKLKSFLFYSLLCISIIELNRELILFSGLLFLIRFYRNYNKILIPSGLSGFVLIILATTFMLVLLKPILYILILGIEYDGGLFNFGETVNWYRWLDYSETRNVDISYVQRNDLSYSFYSIFLPYSPVDSASKIWFSDILGNTDKGRTFGYSGVLWLSNYMSYQFMPLAWFSLFYLYSSKFTNNNNIRIIIYIGLSLISYRFFRSEWPLVLKTFLWTFLYPSLIFYTLSRITIIRSRPS